MCQLIPVDYPCCLDGYCYLKVDFRDSQQIEMMILHNMLFSRAMGEPTKCQEGLCTSLASNWWYDDGRHYKFVNHPFNPLNHFNKKTKKQLMIGAINNLNNLEERIPGLIVTMVKLLSLRGAY
jgi:hypothetical protein